MLIRHIFRCIDDQVDEDATESLPETKTFSDRAQKWEASSKVQTIYQEAAEVAIFFSPLEQGRSSSGFLFRFETFAAAFAVSVPTRYRKSFRPRRGIISTGLRKKKKNTSLQKRKKRTREKNRRFFLPSEIHHHINSVDVKFHKVLFFESTLL